MAARGGKRGGSAAARAAGTKIDVSVPPARDGVKDEGTEFPHGPPAPGPAPGPAAPVAAAPVAGSPVAGSPEVPSWLRKGAGWSWRLLIFAAVIYVLARIAIVLYVVLVPFTGALLLTALLQPLAGRLRRAGLGPLSATWCVFLLALVVIAGTGALITARVQSEYSGLVIQVRHTFVQVQSVLTGPPFHLHIANLQKLSNDIVVYLRSHQSLVEGTVVAGGRVVAEILAGLVLMFFITFFLIKDGDKIWSWLTGGLRPERRERVDAAGHAAWRAVVLYIRGTVVVAAFHATVMGVTLSIMNAPLAAPLSLLMFLAAFVPLVGALVAGALAVLVVLAAKGWLLAVVLLGVLLVMNQVESHLLQPQIVGKMVRLHPLAVILVLAVGGVLGGIFGAVIAVPLTAAISRAVPKLRGDGPARP
jgi:predicted PurR-regulated permease PerM